MPTSPQTFGKKQREERRGTKQQRGYGGEWERISKLKRQVNPVCEYCNDAPAEDVDHVIPFTSIKDPRRTDWQNLRSTCRACHNRKTHGIGG